MRIVFVFLRGISDPPYSLIVQVKLMEDLGIGERRNTSGKGGSGKVSPELHNRLKDMLWKAYREDFLLVEQLTRMREAQ